LLIQGSAKGSKKVFLGDPSTSDTSTALARGFRALRNFASLKVRGWANLCLIGWP
jgi:hypothetical protein